MTRLVPDLSSATGGAPAIMSIRAMSLDLARSMRCDERALSRMIRSAADCGMNMVVLYLEHRFDFPSCPGIAPAGSMTPAIAGRLVAMGRSLGVEVVPGINLIGHCEGIGALERYAHLSADPYDHGPWGAHEQLNLELPEARGLATRMLHDIHQAFPGQWLYVGGDEARRMPYLFPDDPDRQCQALVDHYRFMLDISRATGRQVMMTADMARHHPQLLDTLPRDVMLIDWYYGYDARGIIAPQLTDAGFNVLMMPTIDSHSCFSTRPAAVHDNLGLVVAHARRTQLPGFMAAIWECVAGVTPDLCWPWAALACQMADGQVEDPRRFIRDWAADRYGVDGASFLALHELLGDELRRIIHQHGRGLVMLSRLRKSLFRGADVFEGPIRPVALPANTHVRLWEPSPFHTWLLLRPVLDDALLAELRSLADQAMTLRGELASADGRHRQELVPLLGLAQALEVMVDRLAILRDAQQAYHQAAMAQQQDAGAFTRFMKQSAGHLRRLRPGIETLQRIARANDEQVGLDAGEHRWLELHLKSLDEHVHVIEQARATDDALLDFGEFLRRPAGIGVRVPWR